MLGPPVCTGAEFTDSGPTQKVPLVLPFSHRVSDTWLACPRVTAAVPPPFLPSFSCGALLHLRSGPSATRCVTVTAWPRPPDTAPAAWLSGPVSVRTARPARVRAAPSRGTPSPWSRASVRPWTAPGPADGAVSQRLSSRPSGPPEPGALWWGAPGPCRSRLWARSLSPPRAVCLLFSQGPRTGGPRCTFGDLPAGVSEVLRARAGALPPLLSPCDGLIAGN